MPHKGFKRQISGLKVAYIEKILQEVVLNAYYLIPYKWYLQMKQLRNTFIRLLSYLVFK